MTQPLGMVEPIQEDREAAAEFYERKGNHLRPEPVRAGRWDEDPVVQLVASVRLAAEARTRDAEVRLLGEQAVAAWACIAPDAGPMPPAAAKTLWKKHGGSQHGPNVEQYYIEEQAWYRFVAELQRQTLAARPLDTHQPAQVALLVAIQLVARFVKSLTNDGQNNARMLSINHDELSAIVSDSLVALYGPKALAAFRGGGDVG